MKKILRGVVTLAPFMVALMIVGMLCIGCCTGYIQKQVGDNGAYTKSVGITIPSFMDPNTQPAHGRVVWYELSNQMTMGIRMVMVVFITAHTVVMMKVTRQLQVLSTKIILQNLWSLEVGSMFTTQTWEITPTRSLEMVPRPSRLLLRSIRPRPGSSTTAVAPTQA